MRDNCYNRRLQPLELAFAHMIDRKLSLKNKISAGLLLFRRLNGLEVLLVHPGGPFWHRKDDGAWMLPKGEIEDGEDALAAARREFAEETGHDAQGQPLSLGTLTQAGGKLVHAWAIEEDWDPQHLVSNTFEMEWPPKSGRNQSFPEIDAAVWFPLQTARQKILKSQSGFLDRLEAALASNSD
jgi:predicted NUDIX family NTP pyrophosphohydrolase